MTPEEKEAYIEGRLVGLHKLIKILKEVVRASGASNPILDTIVRTLADEVDNILLELGRIPEPEKIKVRPEKVIKEEKPKEKVKVEEKPPVLEKLVEEKVKPISVEKKEGKKKERSADEILKELLKLKEKVE